MFFVLSMRCYIQRIDIAFAENIAIRLTPKKWCSASMLIL